MLFETSAKSVHQSNPLLIRRIYHTMLKQTAISDYIEQLQPMLHATLHRPVESLLNNWFFLILRLQQASLHDELSSSHAIAHIWLQNHVLSEDAMHELLLEEPLWI